MKSTAQLTVGGTILFVAGMGCGTRPPPGLLDGGVPYSTGVCQHTCTRDPGPPPMTEEACSEAEVGLELARPMVWDFEPTPMLPDRADSLYSYTDNTEPIASFFVDEGGGRLAKITWQPFTTVMPRCGNPTNRVIHVQGGPFLGWGGGIGTSFQYHQTLGGRKTTPATDIPASAAGIMFDASEWEGVSFWARRGPDSQSGFRVSIGDKQTDDDVSYLMHRDAPTLPRFCERVRECACLNHMPCTEVTDLSTIPAECGPSAGQPVTGRTFCGQPLPLVSGDVPANSGTYVQCNTCSDTRCNERYPAYPDDNAQTDVQFAGKQCRPATYRNGVSSAFCLAADEKVPEPDEQCGDHWTKTVALTNEWQFFKVPFTHMIQQGWAKKFAALDATAVSVLRFTWDGGWVDYYIDDVTFYRYKR